MRLGVATHRYDDGSEGKIDVELYPKGRPGYAVTVLPRDGDHWHVLGISGAGQARRLAEILLKASDRLERRGEL